MSITNSLIMKGIYNKITNQLDLLPPITLQEMSTIRLMNRTDTKYIMPLEKLPVFLHQVQNDYFVQEIDSKRISTYHTIYFDTEDEAMFTAHQNGKRVREKIRIRTYKDSSQSFLEIKHKNNKGRTNKKRIPVACLNPLQEKEAKEFLLGYARHEPNKLMENLENKFYRITLVNKGKTERLTIDYEIHFHNLRTDLNARAENLVIVELKRDGYVESPVLKILRELKVKPVSISKYCVGAILTNPKLKHNRFKTKLLQINKLTNTQTYGRITGDVIA